MGEELAHPCNTYFNLSSDPLGCRYMKKKESKKKLCRFDGIVKKNQKAMAMLNCEFFSRTCLDIFYQEDNNKKDI